MTTTKTAFATKYHRDATVPVWDVYRQGWVRTAAPSDRVLASLTEAERARIARHIAKAA